MRATRALVSARRAAERAGVDAFRLPEPVRLDAGRRLLYLAELPGRALTELLAAGELDRDAALHRLGRVHREVHELDVPHGPCAPQRGLARRSPPRPPIRSPRSAPSAGDAGGCAPRPPGDGRCRTTPTWRSARATSCRRRSSAIPSGWAVLDFDDAHLADPHAEVAALSVALGRELPHDSPADADAARGPTSPGTWSGPAGRSIRPAGGGSSRWPRCATSRAAWSRAAPLPARPHACSIELEAGSDAPPRYV